MIDRIKKALTGDFSCVWIVYGIPILVISLVYGFASNNYGFFITSISILFMLIALVSIFDSD